MGMRRWPGWMVVIAVVSGVALAGSAEGAGPHGKAPAAASKELEEAKRLAADADRLEKGGQYDEAIPLAQRALAIREKALGPDHPDVAASLDALAELYLDKQAYARAEPLYERALVIREKVLGPDHPEVAESLNGLALVLTGKGDRARAEPLCKRALAIREKALGPDHPHVAVSLNNLAELYRNKGDDARAEPLCQRALAIREKALGPDHPDVAESANNLAQLYVAKGDQARAEPLLQRALTTLEKALGPDHPDVAISLNNLALLYQAKGDYARAEPLYPRAMAIREKELGPGHPDVAVYLNNLASLYAAQGDYARAEPLYQRALAIREKALGPDHLDVASSLDNLAMLYLDQGATPARRPSISGRPGHPGEGARARPHRSRRRRSLNNLAALHLAQGRLPQAVDAARRAADIQDRNAAAILATGSEDQKRLYMITLLDDTRLDVSLHVQHAPARADAARLALTVLLRRKGRVLDAMTDSLAALRRSFEPADRELLDRLASVYARLAAQVSRGPERASSERYRSGLAALDQERQALEATVGLRSAAFRAEQRLVTLPEVQAKIPGGAALVEIARYAPRPLHPGRHAVGGAPAAAPRYVAYVLRPTGDPTFADLGEAASLEAAVGAFRRALGDPDIAHDPRPAARALDRLVMAPVRALLGETRWVFVSPDGALNLVPFGALADEKGHYLVERYLFSYLTSGRDLLRFEDKPPPSREAPLILANPAFDAASDATSDVGRVPAPEATRRDIRSIDMVTHALLPLESTAAEARTIARLFPDSRVLLGADATEEAVKAAHGPRLLHLATHGFFLPEQAVPAALLGDRGAEPTPAERAALLQRESPLLRSGVALAGFNRRRSGSDAGVLTALEAAGLDLYGTRLVVLSTCESGLGEASTGEGVYGMRRALTMAGAETQVMSLWKVDTGRTRELMGAYYQRLKDGAGRSEAMRAVQLAMLADPKTASPNLWASFIVSGEWRTLEGGSAAPVVSPVEPGPRGCACGHAGEEPRGQAGWVGVTLAGVLLLRRRRGAGRSRA